VLDCFIVLSLVKIFATTQILNVKGCCQWYPTECSDEYSKGYSRLYPIYRQLTLVTEALY